MTKKKIYIKKGKVKTSHKKKKQKIIWREIATSVTKKDAQQKENLFKRAGVRTKITKGIRWRTGIKGHRGVKIYRIFVKSN